MFIEKKVQRLNNLFKDHRANQPQSEDSNSSLDDSRAQLFPGLNSVSSCSRPPNVRVEGLSGFHPHPLLVYHEETEAQRRHPGQNLSSHSLPPEPKAPEQLLSEAPPKCPGPRAMEGSEHLLDMNLFNPHGDLLPSLHI